MMSEVAIAALVLVVNGAALTSFWAWTRSKINLQTGQIAILMEFRANTEKRCLEHRENFREVFQKIDGVYVKIDEVKQCFHAADTETARAVGRLEGKMASFLESR